MSSSSRAAAAVPAPSSGDGGGRDQANEEGIRGKKKALRKRMKSELKAMSEEAVSAASAAVAERLLAFPQLLQQQDKDKEQSGAVSVYMSMPGELDTTAIVSELFKRGRKVYIPKVKKGRKNRRHRKQKLHSKSSTLTVDIPRGVPRAGCRDVCPLCVRGASIARL